MVKGFRPGKEPPELKKRRAKEQYGDVTGTQERLIELFAERTPEESRALIRSWIRGLLAGAIVLGVVAGIVTIWSLVAGVVVGALAGVVLFLWWRLRRQREAFEEMADTVSGRR
jgi:Flp pilus assembly protein TadB